MSKLSSKQPAKLTGRDVLIAFICVLYLASIIGNFYLLRKMDRDYSDLIDHSVPVLNQLNKVTASAAYAMHATYPTLFAESAPKRVDSLKMAREALANEMKFRAELFNTNGMGVEVTDMAELQSAGSDFSRIGNEIVGLYTENRSAEANTLREQKFRPALERYLAATKVLSNTVSRLGEESNSQITVKTKKSSLAILSLGGWPVVIFLGVVLSISALLMMLMFIMAKCSIDLKLLKRK